MDQNIPQQNQFGIGGQPQFAQPGAATQFNSMFANMGVPETPAGGQAAPVDPNEWQLQCDAQHESVEAIIRILPRGLAGVQGNLWPHVNCRKHYLKKRDNQRWGEGPIICRGNIPDPNAKYGKSYCPLCKETWDRYYKIKNTYGDQAAKDSGISGNLSVDDIYVNVLILNDFVHPENNGQIKIWHAKTKQWDKVMAALPERNVNKNGQAKQQYTSTAKYVGIPWHVLSGAIFHLKGTWDTTKAWGTHKGAAVWDASEFEPMATPLAQSDEGIMQILNQCHDLSKYELQPKSVEELEGVTRSFYAAYDGAPAMAADNNNNIAANGYPSYQQPAQYGQQQYAQPGQGGTMPASTPSAYVPPQPKTTVGNAGAFFNNPAAPNYGQPQPQQSAYVTPGAAPVQQSAYVTPGAAPAQQSAFATPGAAPAPQSAFATPGAVPGAAPVQQSAFATPAAPQASFGAPAPQQAAPQFAAPAAQPAQQYVPPAAPTPQPNQFAGAPGVGGTPAGTSIQVDDDGDLPF
jgi:hypothetical protein